MQLNCYLTHRLEHYVLSISEKKKLSQVKLTGTVKTSQLCLSCFSCSRAFSQIFFIRDIKQWIHKQWTPVCAALIFVCIVFSTFGDFLTLVTHCERTEHICKWYLAPGLRSRGKFVSQERGSAKRACWDALTLPGHRCGQTLAYRATARPPPVYLTYATVRGLSRHAR